jgi:DNA-binding MurR/RpiR family transcriptional regulator
MSDLLPTPDDSTLPPASLAALREMIAGRRVLLPERIETVARYMLENPSDAAFGTTRSIAAQCRVAPATVHRFAQELGFRHFVDLKQLFRQNLKSTADARLERSRAVPAGARTE